MNLGNHAKSGNNRVFVAFSYKAPSSCVRKEVLKLMQPVKRIGIKCVNLNKHFN